MEKENTVNTINAVSGNSAVHAVCCECGGKAYMIVSGDVLCYGHFAEYMAYSKGMNVVQFNVLFGGYDGNSKQWNEEV